MMPGYRRTQPLRRSSGRHLSQALAAARAGKPAFMANPADARRQALRKKRKKRHGGDLYDRLGAYRG